MIRLSQRGSVRAPRLFGGVLVCLMLGHSAIQAQYFGKNKVTYREFDFRVLETEHFSVHYYQREARAAADDELTWL